MADTSSLLKRVLFEIEKNIKNKINAMSLAETVAISSVHLQRLFRLAFEKPIASYIRSRKLAVSLESLLKTDLRIIDIAEEYGFEYEQSYTRAFKREYGVAPSEARLAGSIIKIVPPLHLIEKNKMGDGLFFGPELVMVPKFHVVGRFHKVPFTDSIEITPRVAKDFWINDRRNIENRLGNDVYIGLTRYPTPITDFSYYLPSVQVNKPENYPKGLYADTFPASLCAKFHYVSKYHYFDLSEDVSLAMYNAIAAYRISKDAKYELLSDKVHFERISKDDFDGTYYKLEWFSPVVEKR